MLHAIQNYKRIVAGLGLATMLTVSMAAPALAVDTVTGEVTAGTTLTASIADGNVGSVAASNAVQTTTGTLNLTVDDARGNEAGWNVTVESGSFVDGTDSIPNTGFSVVDYGSVTVNSGEAVDATLGPREGSAGTLTGPVMVFEADAGAGTGNYSLGINVSLDVPAYTPAGTYVATLVVTEASGPAA